MFNLVNLYPIKILTQEEMAPYILEMTQYSFKNQLSMHGNAENMLFWSQFEFQL